MTDPFDPTDRAPDVDDDLASAYLDGAATPGEIERVESDGTLADRVGELSAVSGRVGDVPPPPPGTLDGAISAALAEYDRMGYDLADHERRDSSGSAAGDDLARSTAPVVDLATRRPAWQRLPLGAVAAVVVLVALVGVVSLASRTGDDAADTAASAFEDSADDGGDDAASDAGSATESEAMSDDMDAAGADAPDAAFDSDDASALRVERQEFSSADELADRLRQQLEPAPDADDGAAQDDTGDTDEEGTGGDGAGDDAVDPCDAVRVIGLDPSTVRTLVPVRLDGAPATAVVHGGEGDERLVVVDDGTCDVIVDREL